MSAIVSCESVGKQYLISHQGGPTYVAMRDVIAAAIRRPFRRADNGHPRASTESFWALKDVSFDVEDGEVLGIIGRNGAGKSTLLKILSRITEPSAGRLTLDGRVASLLEVGTGFHPELTGRENIFLNGAILGMSRAEIARKFDAIVAFAGVETFLDTPVKRYSSGMYVRLAFAVAAHLEPEILIVDEVLAVGDAEFQKKCLGKMQEVSRGGRTVLFVSHNMAAVQTLCSRVLWLDRGTVRFTGPVHDGVNAYLSASESPAPDGQHTAVTLTPTLTLRSFTITPSALASGAATRFELTFAASEATQLRHLTLLIYSLQEVRVAIVDLRSAGFPRTMAAGETTTITGVIRSLPLVEGDYRVGIGFSTDDRFEDRLGLVTLTVAPRPAPAGFVPYEAQYRGFIDLDVAVDR